ncbi:hypothetical protein RchiOBHm_Chr2g0122781 [Rosa chinensis]|uniref:Uncharacterized protein n=1 Tax=Rosa chinensis TaxID=74649 RepID=A0A2P6RSX4_ROSCH|nr:uncharacterized protein LOC112188220 [Rosa chinensis]PRQ49515.1 hypothetical protein RchiOBHm_Chr2g0122781 [Rosa chinensis]
MAFSVSTATASSSPQFHFFSFHSNHQFPVSLSLPTHTARLLVSCCAAAKPQTGPVKKKRSPSSPSTTTTTTPTNNNNSKKKRKAKDNNTSFSKVEIVDDFGSSDSGSLGYHPTPLPKPPAGFVVDDHGRVLMASSKRIASIVDPTNNFPLECVIRRVFRSSRGDECMLLCPVDTPVQILKSTNIDGWSAVSDEEVEAILPSAAYALAKIHMHLVHSGFCYTARGGFCYSEDDIFDFRTDDGEDVDGLPTEGVEITCFHLDGAHYMVYTPSDPLLFVAVKDDDGLLQIADDDLLEDPAIISAIDEETEFNALVEEEAALLDSLLGKE